MAEDKIKKLYNELKDTYELGSENDFRSYLSNPSSREALRKELEADYDVGDSLSFSKYLGFEEQGVKSPSPTTEKAKESQSLFSNIKEDVKSKVAQEETPVSIQPNPYTPMSVSDTPRPRTAAEISADAKSIEERKKERENWKKAGERVANESFEQTLGRIHHETESTVNRTLGRVRANSNIGLRTDTPTLNLHNRNVREIYSGKIDPQTGKQEKVYITESGNEYGENERAMADVEQQQIDDQKRLDWLKAEMEKEKANINAERKANTKNARYNSLGASYQQQTESDKRLKDLEQEYAELNWRVNQGNGVNVGVREQLAELDSKIGDKWKLSATQAASYGGSVTTTKEDINYSLAHQISERTKNIMATAEANTHGRSFFGNLGAGVYDSVSDAGTWDFGLSALAQNRELKDIVAKMEKGEDLAPDQEALLDAVIVNQYVTAAYSGQLGRGYKAGQVTGESLPFMLEMIVNPLSGTGNALANRFAKSAAKHYAKKMGNRAAVRAIEKMTTKQLGNMFSGSMKWGIRGAKWGGQIAGDVLGAAGITATSSQARVLADALSRNIGEIKYKPEVGEDGRVRLVYDGTKGGEGMFDAYLDAFLAQYTENHSEMIGEYFAPISNAIGRVLGRGLKTNVLGREILEFVKNAKADDWYKLTSDLRSRAKFSDGFGEFSEEIAGGIENSLLVGDQTLDTNSQTGVFNLDNLIDTYLGVNVMNVVFGAVGLGGYRTSKYRARTEMTAADDAGLSAFGDRNVWGPIRNTLSFGSEQDRKNMLHQIFGSGNFNEAQKRAALHYAKAADAYKALQSVEGKQKDEPQNAYEEGLSLTGAERNEAGRKLREAEDRLTTPQLRDSAQEIDGMVESGDSYDDILLYISTLSSNEQPVLTDYVQSKLRVKGIRDNANSEVEDQVLQFVQGIAPAIQEDENGKTITVAKLDGEQVLVISDDGGNAIVYSGGQKRPVKSKTLQDVQTFDYNDFVNIYQQSVEESSADELNFALNNHPNTQMPKAGLVLHHGEDTYQVVNVNPTTGEVTATKVKLDKEGNLVSDGSIVQFTQQEVLYYQNQYYDELDERKNGAAKEEAVGETEQTTQPGVAPSSASSVTTDLAQMEQDMTAIDPDAPQYIEMVQYAVDEYGYIQPDFYNGVPQALVEPLKAYEEAYKASKEQFVAEEGVSPVTSTESQGDTAPETEQSPDYPRDKDGDLDVTAIQDTGDTQMMADALLGDFGPETANATAQQYLTDAVKAQEKEKNPVKKNGSRKKAVDYWRDVASRINAATEQPTQPIDEASVTEQTPTLEAGSAATEKWANANKIVGSEGVYTMDDGSDIDGRYVLVEEGASTPSHDPHTFQSSEGYPVNEQGQNVNSRDYQNSSNAQASVMQMGSDYDGRALKDVPVVSVDGIVWSGNNRTMSGILAAENGSDGKYIESLKKQAPRFGFTPEQVEGMEHPRVVFVPNEGQGLDYTPQTFNRFNAPAQKEESSVEKGVKMGKVLRDRTFNLLSQEVSRFDGMKNVFKSENACREILRIMQESPEIVEVNQQTLPRYITPDGLLTEDGQNLLNAALVGYMFKDNADVLRYLDKLPKRAVNQLAEAMNELTANARTGDYALTAELSEAMRALYEQQQSGLNMEEFLKQQDMFRDNSLYSQTAQALIKALDSKSGTPLKDILSQYNERAVGASSGQADMFSSNSREDILRDVLALPNEQAEKPVAQSEQLKPADLRAESKPDSKKLGESKAEREAKLSDKDVENIIDAMKGRAIVAPFIEITDNNWRENIDTPLGNVKMGNNQKEKLFANGREQQYGMLIETLSNPDIVLEESDKEENLFHERPSSYIFVKTFLKSDGTKYVHFESVTVSQDGMEVSVSSHIIRENQLREKLKSDRLLYKATALDESAPSSAEQPINEVGSPSSASKDTDNSGNAQGKSEENTPTSHCVDSNSNCEIIKGI